MDQTAFGEELFVLGFLVLSMLACGGLGYWIAGEKNRKVWEGFGLGFLFGPLGILVELLLPTK